MDWTVVGINYQKANIEQRQRYALGENEIADLYEHFLRENVPNALVISTCNRTEFFIPSLLKTKVLDILAKHVYDTDLDLNFFHQKEGDIAIEYFFRICSGLESQIAGDFEILGQVKRACALSKQSGMLSGVWEKIINNGLAAAKKARTQTGFYSGATSTSYAIIEYLKGGNFNLKEAKYLILGAGKIGSHTVDHLLKFAPSENISIANRSLSKALDLAKKKNLGILPMQHLSLEAHRFDVIVCATNAPHYILDSKSINTDKKYKIIDLSLPLNVDPKLKEFDNIDLVNVDELSEIINLNLQKRDAEREHVEAIIEEGIKDLYAWFTIKTGMPVLAELRAELNGLKNDALSKLKSDNIEHSTAFIDEYTDELFNQLSQNWIRKVRNKTMDAD